MISNTKCLLALAAMSLLASCGDQTTNDLELKAKSSNDLASATGEVSNNAALFAAAEEFETLTESSFSADIASREKTIAKVSNAAARVAKFASPELAAQLQTHLGNIRAAQKNNAPADLAIASNEAFRVLVSAIAGNQKTPVNVSLLDYAGFRFDADAQAIPARFDDMEESVLFAQAQWAGIKSRPEIAKLSARFSASLDNMDLAARSGDVAKARAAAKVELDMVDELETAFGQ
ncbi:hypothetical protein [Sphingorhabdus sp.]|uniref:hypothetical protein n=1 Tax=Sphingorhabdus sp. TaxID=1902408 RepID=UPI0039839F57